MLGLPVSHEMSTKLTCTLTKAIDKANWQLVKPRPRNSFQQEHKKLAKNYIAEIVELQGIQEVCQVVFRISQSLILLQMWLLHIYGEHLFLDVY